MRLTPQSASSAANRESCEPLVVSVSSSQRAAFEMARQLAHQMHDVLAHQRLAAGQPELAHALLDEDRAEPVELFQRQQILLRQEGHILGHAIGAAEIAAVGDRDAQIADCATEGVDHVHELRSNCLPRRRAPRPLYTTISYDIAIRSRPARLGRLITIRRFVADEWNSAFGRPALSPDRSRSMRHPDA